ncbi:MAG: PAS domain S-box protein, partial [Acidobacteria bacterium]|nr:PAS domain S-box protein [Acidobacteriota bacterium]
MLTAIYVGTSWLIFSFAYLEKRITLVCPPAGIALAAVLLLGYRIWPGLVLGPIITGILVGAPFEFILAITIGTPLGAMVSAYLLRHWVHFHNDLDRGKDVLGLIFPGAIATALISATMGVSGLCLSGSISWLKCGLTWGRWFLADILGILVVVPALLTWSAVITNAPRIKNPRKLVESSILTMLIIIAGFGVYGGWFQQNITYSISYIIFPLTIWAALRFGTRAVATILFYWTGVAIWGTVKGFGPFVHSSLSEDIVQLDFTILLLISFLLLAAVIAERKQAQLTLRESEERYRLLIEHSPEAIFVHTGNKIEFVNPAALQLLGADSADQLINKAPLDFLHPDFTGPVLEQMQQLLVEKKSVPMSEEKFIRLDGISIDVEAVSIPITFQGKPAIQMVARDITARKRAEEALRVSEARFRELSDAAEEGLAIHDQGTILEANEALARMFGYSLPEILGMFAGQLATPETWEIIKKHIAENYNKPYEGIGIRKDGSTFWCEMVGKPYMHHGKMLRLAVFRDISEQKKAEEAQRISENRYRRLFESAQDGLLIMDAETAEVIDLNPRLEKMLAYPREELVGKSFWEIEPFKTMTTSSQNAFDQLPTAEFIHYEHLAMVNIAGRHMDVEFTCNTFYDNHRNVSLCNIRDITARKQAEEKMRQAQMAIARANELKNEFLTSISHEIRTPMNSILGFAQLLEELIIEKQCSDVEKKITKESKLAENVCKNLQKEYITAIKSCSEVLINLLNDILDYKKIEAGKLELQYEFFTPQSVLTEMKQIFMPKIKEKNLELIIKTDPELPGTIFLDKLRMRQILFNLINNAIKFTLRGFIKLELHKTGNVKNEESCDLMFSVQDTGTGISKDQLENIFEAFTQKRGQDMGKFGGTGLGLTIAKHLAHMMNG